MQYFRQISALNFQKIPKKRLILLEKTNMLTLWWPKSG